MSFMLKAENKNEAAQYDGTWRDADPAEVKAMIDAGVPHTYRFKVPKGKVWCPWCVVCGAPPPLPFPSLHV